MEMGWIMLHRAIRRNWIWEDGNKLKWWLDLLLQANHKANKILLGNHLILVERGSLHTSLQNLAKRWEVDKKTVKKFLDLLQKDSMISLNSSRKGTTIKISNYNLYQGFSEDESPAVSPTLSTTISTPSPPTMDNTVDNKVDNPMAKGVDTALDKDMDYPLVNGMDNPLDPTMDTNNNDNNANNLNNSKNGEEGKEKENQKEGQEMGQREPWPCKAPLLPPFPSPSHEKLFKSLGEIAYRTWFVDAIIDHTTSGACLKVDSEFKFDVINKRFKTSLEQILGKKIDVVVG